LSERAHKEVTELWQKLMGYDMIVFNYAPIDGDTRVHHTAHMFFLGSGYALLAPELISEEDRPRVLDRLKLDGIEVIPISTQQVFHFCAQAFEAKDGDGNLRLVMSSTAYSAFTKEQLTKLQTYVKDVTHVDLSTLEVLGGGGVHAVVGRLY